MILCNVKAIFGEALELPKHIDLLLPAKEGWQGTEHDLQVNFFKFLAELRLNDPYLHLVHAVPNGGKRDKITAGQLVAEGAKAGVPDVSIPLPRGKFPGMYIEFKRAGVKPDEEQRVMLLMLDRLGYKVIVTNCLEVAKAQFNLYYHGR